VKFRPSVETHKKDNKMNGYYLEIQLHMQIIV